MHTQPLGGLLGFDGCPSGLRQIFTSGGLRRGLLFGVVRRWFWCGSLAICRLRWGLLSLIFLATRLGGDRC
eukprot:1984269-Amphidinium_carterae.2